MHRRAYSASCKARVMQAKANPPKEKARGGPDRLNGGLHDWASSCVGAPTRRRESGLPLLVRKVELQMPAHSVRNVTRRLPLLGILLALIVVAGALIWLTAERHDTLLDTKHNEFSGR